MQNPVREIPNVIHLLSTNASSEAQRRAIETYFLPDAVFTHTICSATPRHRILAIYRWYHIISPVVDLSVNSVAFDEANRTLYVSMRQSLTFWIFPWISPSASLVTVLNLEKLGPDQNQFAQNGADPSRDRWYIARQSDYYDTDEFSKFIPVVGPLLKCVFYASCGDGTEAG